MSAMSGFQMHEFASREALAAELAHTVAGNLAEAIQERGRATLAVSGGTTPARFFVALSKQDLRWDRVKITLVDDRFVEHTSERSNERLVREHLLTAKAGKASFHPLCWGDPHNGRRLGSLEDEAEAADRLIRPLRTPLDVVVLGMGTDGHTASFFPDAPNLDVLTDIAQKRRVLAVDAPSGGEPRITLTLPLIVEARHLVLHIEGDAKRQVLDAALAQAAPRLPIARVFDAVPSPIDVYWAP